MSRPDLTGLRVLLTRPQGQNDSLRSKLAAAGAQVRELPLLEIEPLAETPALRQQIMNLDHYQMVVVVSPNAARVALDLIDRYWPQLPVGIDWLTVGKGTAKALQDYGIAALAPPEGHDSEALLSLPRLQQVSGEKVLILRGEGGRDFLARTLRERGAQVEFAELYRRVVPAQSAQGLGAAVKDFDPQVILLFSGSTFEHLWQLCQAQGVALDRASLWLPSQRVADQVRAQGLEQVKPMLSLEDEAIVQALGEWHHQVKRQ